MTIRISFFIICYLLFYSCSKRPSEINEPPLETPKPLNIASFSLNDLSNQANYYNVAVAPVVLINFDKPVDKTSLSAGVIFKTQSGVVVPYNITYVNDSSVSIKAASALEHLNKYVFTISSSVKSTEGTNLKTPKEITFITSIDSTDKFPRISDEALLDLIQKQTFEYFNDFAHPVSGMARERNSSGDVVTTGGTGFGVMSIIAAVNRNFISRSDGLGHVQKNCKLSYK